MGTRRLFQDQSGAGAHALQDASRTQEAYESPPGLGVRARQRRFLLQARRLYTHSYTTLMVFPTETNRLKNFVSHPPKSSRSWTHSIKRRVGQVPKGCGRWSVPDAS